MKPKFNRLLIASSVALAALSSYAWAQTTWNGSVDGSWSSTGNWSAGIPDSADLVTYGAGIGVGTAVANGTQTLDAPRAVLGLSVGNDAASPITINSGAGTNALTIGTSGIVLNSGSGGNFTSNADIIMAGAQSFTTGSDRSITVNNVANGGFLLTVNTAGATSTTAINGVLSGAGGLVKSGTGALTLSANNTYTGSTVINAGTLALTGSAVLGGASGSTTDAGNIVFGSNQNSGRLEFQTAANLGAADQIRFRNTGGTPGQGGALVYVGTTAQTLSKTIQSDTSIGIRLESNSVGGSLTLNGAFSQTNRPLYLGGTGIGNNTLAMAFNGSGTLTKRDVGTWLLTASNANTGNTTVSEGTLAIRSGGGIFRDGFRGTQVLSVGSGAILELQNWLYDQSTGSLGGLANTAGRIVIDGGTIRMTGTTTYGRGVTVNAGGATFEAASGTTWAFDDTGDGNIAFVYNDNPSLTFAGDGSFVFNKDFSGTGALTKSGSGTLTLPTATSHTGATNVTGGTLVIGSAGSLANTTTTIGVNGTLVGGGSIGGATTIQGTHSPGFSPGTQTFTNSLSYANTATLDWELNANTTVGRGTAYDAVDVSGGSFALTTGATIDLSFIGTVDFLNAFWGTDQEWLVVDLSGSATAADSNLFTIGSITGGANYSPSLGSFGTIRKDGSTTADAVYLTWTAVPEPSSALLGGIGLLLLLRRRR